MKKLFTILSIAFCLFTATSCVSKISAIKKAFVKEGYSWQELNLNEETEEEEEEEEKQEKSVVKGVYLAQKGLTGNVLVIELQATNDMAEAVKTLKEDPNIDGNYIVDTLLQAYTSSEYTYGNCVAIILPIDSASKEIWDNLTGKTQEEK